ncbi:MAG TPA: hypothetical protein VJ521_14165 [Acidobacteriota bacterium]|nr:hypothetical protein [Acidobacteriota bacterium]
MSTREGNGRLHFFAEKTLANDPAFLSIFAGLPDLEWIDDYQSFRRQTIVQEKRCVVFARKRGAWLKPFHCYDNPKFTYLSLDIAEGCLFDCVYCYLQTYLNHGALVLFVDIDQLQGELRRLEGGNYWISTGLLSDSFLAESFYPVMARISQWIPLNSTLELRSKSGEVHSLADPGIKRDSVVVAWSLNPQPVAATYEYRAASLECRLRAAREALDLGYRVAFHFDPVFYFEGWRDAYAKLFEEIRDFPPKRVAFLSIGLFRYMPDLGAMIRKRFPFHPVLTQEFFPDADGKYHYFRAIRKEMYRNFCVWLEPWKDVPVFWSMEPDRRLRIED